MKYASCLIVLAASLSLPWLTACNTVEGAGRDVEGIGEATQDVADEVREDIHD